MDITNLHIDHVDEFQEISFEFLESDDLLLCCLAPAETDCSLKVPEYISCSHLIDSTEVRVAIYVVSSWIVVACFVVISLEKHVFVRKLTKSAAFSFIVVGHSVSFLFCAISFFMLWIVDVIHSTNFVFVSSQWRSSPFCPIVSSLLLLFIILSGLLLGLLSYSRYSLIRYPLESRMRETRYVVKILQFLGATSIFGSIIFASVQWMYESVLESVTTVALCSPFIDPEGQKVFQQFIIYFTATFEVTVAVCCSLAYSSMYFVLIESQTAMKHSSSKQGSNVALLAQIVVMILSCLLCSVTSSMLFVASLFLPVYPFRILEWATVILVPMNSIVNTVIFIFLSVRRILRV